MCLFLFACYALIKKDKTDSCSSSTFPPSSLYCTSEFFSNKILLSTFCSLSLEHSFLLFHLVTLLGIVLPLNSQLFPILCSHITLLITVFPPLLYIHSFYLSILGCMQSIHFIYICDSIQGQKFLSQKLVDTMGSTVLFK